MSAASGGKRAREGGSDVVTDSDSAHPAPHKQAAVANADASAPLFTHTARTRHDGAGLSSPAGAAGAITMADSVAGIAAPASVAPTSFDMRTAPAPAADLIARPACAGVAAAAAPAPAASPAAAHASAGASPAAAHASAGAQAQVARVLVKVGHGKDLVFEHAGVLGMHSAALLKALATDESFRVRLQRVPLDECTVVVVASAQKVPSAAEEGAAVELAADDTLQGFVDKLVATRGHLPMGTKLFIRVQLGEATASAADVVEHIAAPSSKTFTINGAIAPDKAGLHFFVPSAMQPLVKHIESSTFFMLHGARGAGKTTTALHTLWHLRVKRGWLPLTVNMNAVDTGTTTTFWKDLCAKFKGQAADFGVVLPDFDSPGTFQLAFMRSTLDDRVRFVLVFDEFDDLDSPRVGADVKEKFLGAVRDIKQSISNYAIQCIFAVGPFSILFMNGERGSPFNVREAVPVHMLEGEEVERLLRDFADARGITLEDGIIADVFRLTAGHAGLVCACGRELDTAVLHTGGTITLARWTNHAMRTLPLVVRDWPTIGSMANRLASFSPMQKHVLELMLAAGDCTVTARSADEIAAAQFLVAEGWLRSAGEAASAHRYVIASPLVRGIALAELAKHAIIAAPLPLDSERQLIFPDVITTSLPFFKAAVMSAASDVSSKTSAARVPGAAKHVPSEAAYHAQLAAVLSTWLRAHFDVFTEADSFVEVASGADGTGEAVAEGRAIGAGAAGGAGGAGSGAVGGAGGGGRSAGAGASSAALRFKYANILLIGRTDAAPRHVLQLVASASDADIAEHYARTVAYMGARDGARGTCITFTALAAASGIEAVSSEKLQWPTPEQLVTGLVAIHVVHDVSWTAAVVHCKKAGQAAMLPQSVELARA